MMETYTFNVYRNAQAIVELRERIQGGRSTTRRRTSSPSSSRATNVVLDRYCGEGPVLQGGARLAAQFREDRRAVLDEDQRPVLEPRQRGPRRAAEVALRHRTPAAPAGRLRDPAGFAVATGNRMTTQAPTVSCRAVHDRDRSPVVLVGRQGRRLADPADGAVLVWEVTARYCSTRRPMWAYDMTFMLYGTFFMLGSAWTLQRGGHIRTDSFYSNGRRARRRASTSLLPRLLLPGDRDLRLARLGVLLESRSGRTSASSPSPGCRSSGRSSS